MNLTPQAQQILEMVAHDLRHPLQCIDGYASLLAEGNPARLAHCLAGINVSSRRALALVEDLTDAAALERDVLELRRAVVSLRGLILQAAAALEGRCRSRGIALTVEAPDDRILLVADPERLARVVDNVLANAIKHVEGPGGKISVTVRATGAAVWVEVADSGGGIAPENLERIFEKFFQGDQPERGSVGLGLYIARSVVEAHGGWIRASSQGLGRGATFTLCLPRLAQRHGAAPEAQRPVQRPRVEQGERHGGVLRFAQLCAHWFHGLFAAA